MKIFMLYVVLTILSAGLPSCWSSEVEPSTVSSPGGLPYKPNAQLPEGGGAASGVCDPADEQTWRSYVESFDGFFVGRVLDVELDDPGRNSAPGLFSGSVRIMLSPQSGGSADGQSG
jgi:hypothetical protein